MPLPTATKTSRLVRASLTIPAIFRPEQKMSFGCLMRIDKPACPASARAAATAMSGRAMPSWRSAAAVSTTTRLSRSGVSRSGTLRSAVWVETWLTRVSPCASIITESAAPVRSASSSVWPE